MNSCCFRKMLKVKICGGVRGERFEADYGPIEALSAKAARRTAEGKFTKIIFSQIGGKECRRFAAMTWKERDAFMAKPENAAVRERYETHMASLRAK
jgi:hypothetical protein